MGSKRGEGSIKGQIWSFSESSLWVLALLILLEHLPKMLGVLFHILPWLKCLSWNILPWAFFVEGWDWLGQMPISFPWLTLSHLVFHKGAQSFWHSCCSHSTWKVQSIHFPDNMQDILRGDLSPVSPRGEGALGRSALKALSSSSIPPEWGWQSY